MRSGKFNLTSMFRLLGYFGFKFTPEHLLRAVYFAQQYKTSQERYEKRAEKLQETLLAKAKIQLRQELIERYSSELKDKCVQRLTDELKTHYLRRLNATHLFIRPASESELTQIIAADE